MPSLLVDRKTTKLHEVGAIAFKNQDFAWKIESKIKKGKIGTLSSNQSLFDLIGSSMTKSFSLETMEDVRLTMKHLSPQKMEAKDRAQRTLNNII